VNLAFGTNTTLMQLIDKIELSSGLTAEVHHRDFRPGDVKHSQADNTVLRSLFPDVEPVPLEQGLSETIAWFKETQS
jgi:UDP-glucose 4-epimerase